MPLCMVKLKRKGLGEKGVGGESVGVGVLVCKMGFIEQLQFEGDADALCFVLYVSIYTVYRGVPMEVGRGKTTLCIGGLSMAFD